MAVNAQPPVRAPGAGQRWWRVRAVLALLVAAVALAVMASYWHSRRDLARQIQPVKPLKWSVRQSGQGFTLSRSVDGRTVLRVQADRAVQMRAGNRASLQHVVIELYGSSGALTDRIAGEQFEYDQSSGDVRADGQAEITLEPGAAEPAAAAGAPAVKTPGQAVDVVAQDLTFNVKSGVGSIEHGLTFTYPGASGSAQTALIDSHAQRVVLGGGLRLLWQSNQQPPVTVQAERATLARGDDTIALGGGVQVESGGRSLHAAALRLALRRDNSVRLADAAGDVAIATPGSDGGMAHAHAVRATAQFGDRQAIETAELTGDATVAIGAGGQQGTLAADAITFQFGAADAIQAIQARGQAEMQLNAAGGDRRLRAPELELAFAAAPPGPADARSQPELSTITSVGRCDILLAGVAAALPQLGPSAPTSSSAGAGATGPVQVDADHFALHLVDNRPASSEASGNVRIEQPGATSAAARSARAQTLTLDFDAAQQIRRAVLSGDVRLEQDGGSVQAQQLVATPATQQALFTAPTGGTVDVSTGQMQLHAPRLLVEGNSKVTATGGVSAALLPGPGAPAQTGFLGAAGSGPVNITAASAHLDEAAGSSQRFDGSVRVWQGGNVLYADQVRLVPQPAGRAGGPQPQSGEVYADGNVRTVFLMPPTALPIPGRAGAQAAAAGPAPVTLTADHMHYSNNAGTVNFSDHVTVTVGLTRLTANRLTATLASGPAAPGASGTAGPGPAGLQHAVAEGSVKLAQPGRSAQAQTATYDLRKGIIVLTGGRPSISDAEHGFLTGDPLTFSTRDDAMTVESASGTSPIGKNQIGHN